MNSKTILVLVKGRQKREKNTQNKAFTCSPVVIIYGTKGKSTDNYLVFPEIGKRRSKPLLLSRMKV